MNTPNTPADPPSADPTDTPETASGEPNGLPDADTATADPSTEPDAEPTSNSEAARYRVQRNEARAERDALAERIAGYQRREAERVVADLLEVPGDLWDVGRADVADYILDDGTVDEEELRASAAALIDMRPGLAKSEQSKPGPRNWGQYGGTAPPAKATWQSVVAPR